MRTCIVAAGFAGLSLVVPHVYCRCTSRMCEHSSSYEGAAITAAGRLFMRYSAVGGGRGGALADAEGL